VLSQYQIDYFVLCWAVHRLNGVVLPLHSTSTVAEVAAHMQSARCSTIFTCEPLLPVAMDAATQLAIPRTRMFTLRLPDEFFKNSRDAGGSGPFIDTEALITEGSQLEPLEPLLWKDGQAKEQVAYLCATSGTSGKQVSPPKDGASVARRISN
jgi:long-subunit acyl-CoA synthetase (AMP-forming)